MAELNVTLDNLKFANTDGFSRDFGTKKTRNQNGGSLTTRECNENAAKIFDSQRPLYVTENSSTSRIEVATHFILNDNISLTIEDGSFEGVEITLFCGQDCVLIHKNKTQYLEKGLSCFYWINNEWVQTSFKIKDSFLEKVKKCEYAKLGESHGCCSGFLRNGFKPQKIAVIGNSITSHGFYEQDGISWTVGDYREMASSKPNTGWVSLVKKYITKYLNPDCRVYKANGSIWEKGIEGERDYSLMAEEQAYEVTNTGSVLIDGFTIDTMLTEDTDVVLIQLCENMQVNDKSKTVLDFENLFESIKSKCPNAEIYAFLGFWNKTEKVHSIVSACIHKQVNPVFAPNLIENVVVNDISVYKAQEGDPIYDIDGNKIATVSKAVSGHPNDFGFRVIATYFLDALFNNRMAFTEGERFVYKCEDLENPELTEIRNTDMIYTVDNFQEVYGPLFDSFVLTGEYQITLTFLYHQDSHGILRVENARTFLNTYFGCTQRFIPVNNSTGYVREIYRKTVLSATDTVFGNMIGLWGNNEVDIGRKIKTQYVEIPNNTTLYANKWTTVGQWKEQPTYIVDAFYILPVEIGNVNYHQKTILPRIHSDDLNIGVASPEAEDVSLPNGTILYIKYI